MLIAGQTKTRLNCSLAPSTPVAVQVWRDGQTSSSAFANTNRVLFACATPLSASLIFIIIIPRLDMFSTISIYPPQQQPFQFCAFQIHVRAQACMPLQLNAAPGQSFCSDSCCIALVVLLPFSPPAVTGPRLLHLLPLTSLRARPARPGQLYNNSAPHSLALQQTSTAPRDIRRDGQTSLLAILVPFHSRHSQYHLISSPTNNASPLALSPTRQESCFCAYSPRRLSLALTDVSLQIWNMCRGCCTSHPEPNNTTSLPSPISNPGTSP